MAISDRRVGGIPEPMWNLPRLARQIKQWREERDWSQAELARQSGVSRASIRVIENEQAAAEAQKTKSRTSKGGKPEGPAMVTVLRLVYALGKKPEDVFAVPRREDYIARGIEWYDPEYEAQHAQLAQIMKRNNEADEKFLARVLEMLLRNADELPSAPRPNRRASDRTQKKKDGLA